MQRRKFKVLGLSKYVRCARPMAEEKARKTRKCLPSRKCSIKYNLNDWTGHGGQIAGFPFLLVRQ
jgi:hypothetical protein